MSKQSQKKIPSCLSNRVADTEAYSQYWKDGSTNAIKKLLIEELEARIKCDNVKSDKADKFDLNEWANYQASRIGYREALRELIRLLDQ
jgi:hypothetical protein